MILRSKFMTYELSTTIFKNENLYVIYCKLIQRINLTPKAIYSGIFSYLLLAGMTNYDIAAFRSTGGCSSFELHTHKISLTIPARTGTSGFQCMCCPECYHVLTFQQTFHMMFVPQFGFASITFSVNVPHSTCQALNLLYVS